MKKYFQALKKNILSSSYIALFSGAIVGAFWMYFDKSSIVYMDVSCLVVFIMVAPIGCAVGTYFGNKK
jgi:uncharacterized membrane protein